MVAAVGGSTANILVSSRVKVISDPLAFREAGLPALLPYVGPGVKTVADFMKEMKQAELVEGDPGLGQVSLKERVWLKVGDSGLHSRLIDCCPSLLYYLAVAIGLGLISSLDHRGPSLMSILQSKFANPGVLESLQGHGLDRDTCLILQRYGQGAVSLNEPVLLSLLTGTKVDVDLKGRLGPLGDEIVIPPGERWDAGWRLPWWVPRTKRVVDIDPPEDLPVLQCLSCKGRGPISVTAEEGTSSAPRQRLPHRVVGLQAAGEKKGPPSAGSQQATPSQTPPQTPRPAGSANPRALKIVAKSIYRELADAGFEDNHVMALASELLELVAEGVRARRKDGGGNQGGSDKRR